MAFLAQDPNQQQQDPNNPQANQVAGQGVTIGGGANTSGVLGGTGQSATTSTNSSSGGSPKGTSSGSFTNLQNYVNANQGNDAQMGQQVQGMVQGAAGQADQSGQQFQQGAQQKIQSQTVNEDQGMVNNLKSGSASGIDKDAFGKAWNAGSAYTGPKDASGFDNYGNAQQAYKNVDTYGHEAAGSSGDRQQLLQDTYARNGQQYNQGESTLDSFVLGSGKGGAQALKDINNQYGDYSQNFQNIGNLVNKGIQNAQQTNQTTAQDVQNAAKSGFQTLQGNLDSAATQANSANRSAEALNQQLTSGDANAFAAQGLSGAAIQYLQNAGGPKYNWSQLVNQTQGQHTAADFANAGDVKNYQNLLSLVNGAAPGTLTGKYGADQLTASGATGPSLNSADVQDANTLAGLSKTLNQALGSKQYEAAQQYADMQRSLGQLSKNGMGMTSAQVASLANQLGVNPQDLDVLTGGNLMGSDYSKVGLDPNAGLSQLIRTPGKFGLGDVATTAQQQQFANLSRALGLNPNLTKTNTPVVDFNKDAFNALVQQRKAELAQTAAANAEANANGGAGGNSGDSQPWYNINQYING